MEEFFWWVDVFLVVYFFFELGFYWFEFGFCNFFFEVWDVVFYVVVYLVCEECVYVVGWEVVDSFVGLVDILEDFFGVGFWFDFEEFFYFFVLEFR